MDPLNIRNVSHTLDNPGQATPIPFSFLTTDLSVGATFIILSLLLSDLVNMAKDFKSFRSSFSPLPVEIRQAILSETPDVPTLDAAIEVDDSLRSAFWSNESLILEDVLRKTINPRLIPEVVAVLDSTRFHLGKVKFRVPDDPWTKDEVYRLLGHYFQRQSVSVKWKLADALAVSEIYEHVRYFVDDFASSALSEYLVSGDKELSPSPLSSNERCRLEGVFLRLELFCNLFRERAQKQARFTPDELSDIFFSKFSPWENEQLACVNDYLTDKILIRKFLGFHLS